MKKITIGFSRPKEWTFYSSVIMRLYGTSYSHTFIAFTMMNDETIYEANDFSVKFVDRERWRRDNQVVHEFSYLISTARYEKLVKFCMDSAGIKYGFKQAIGVFFSTLMGYRKNPLGDDSDTLICSELIYHIIRDVLGCSWYVEDTDMVTPRQCYEYLSTHWPYLQKKLLREAKTEVLKAETAHMKEEIDTDGH